MTGKRLVHLQCHIGVDVLSWARHGALVSGLDFSGPAIRAAQSLAAELGTEASFVVSDVYDAVDAFGGQRFDIVYTSVGSLVWLPDIPRWAQVVAAFAKCAVSAWYWQDSNGARSGRIADRVPARARFRRLPAVRVTPAAGRQRLPAARRPAPDPDDVLAASFPARLVRGWARPAARIAGGAAAAAPRVARRSAWIARRSARIARGSARIAHRIAR